MRKRLRSLSLSNSFKNCLPYKTLYSRYTFQFSSVCVVTNLATEHGINEAKLIRLCHTLYKKKTKRKKARIIKYINCDRQVQFLKRLRPVQVCNRATLSHLDLLNGDCFKISLASSPFFNRREKFKFQLKIAY